MLEEILKMRGEKTPYNIIAEQVGVHKNTLCRYLKEVL
jgi:hypothetical protein